MVPAGKPVDENLDELLGLLGKNDIVINGGNTYWKETLQRGEKSKLKDVHFLDFGTSGDVWGLKNGYCVMYVGEKKATNFVEPIFKTLAPDKGYVYCGPSGTGHMVKMVYNGIEFGMMQS